MISELLALTTGAFVGAVVTANIHRNTEATNVRKAIATLDHHLAGGDTRPLGKTTAKLKFYLDLVKEADELFSRSDWAKRQRHMFLAHSVRVIVLRNKGVSKTNQAQFSENLLAARTSGALLIGYLEFPSRLWVKATLARLSDTVRRQLASTRKTMVSSAAR